MRLNKKSGFTLVEILVSSMVLSVGLVAILGGVSLSRESRVKAERLNTARAIAQSYIEDYKARPKIELENTSFSTSNSSLPPGNSVSVTVSQSVDYSESKLSWVRVKVRYPEGRGIREVFYETCITGY